jgi:hypothetical protein
MNINNLNKLIDLFEGLPDHKVNLSGWRSGRDGRYHSDYELANDCDSCGCIVGFLPLLTGIPVVTYRFSQLADFLDVDIDTAVVIGDRNEKWSVPDRDVALERLRGLL